MKATYVFHPLFTDPNADKLLLGPEPPAETTNKPSYGLPPYLERLYDTPLLTPEQEVYLFRKMNYLKWKGRLQEAEEIRNRIVQANLRLVVHVAKNYVDDTQTLEDLISEGNECLFRTVDLFDCSRGNKFSTYATWAVRNRLYRAIGNARRQRDRFSPAGDSESLQTIEARSDAKVDVRKVEAKKAKLFEILDRLPERERVVISRRFGLDYNDEPQSYGEIAAHFGLSKERIRQITERALGRMRETCGVTNAI